MMSRYDEPRPPLLTLIIILGFLWSGLTVIRVIAWSFLALVLGVGSWLLGPVPGMLGSLFGMAIIGMMLCFSALSILLFMAAWSTLQGNPSGPGLFRLWAWINIVVDGVVLIFTGGLSPAAWFGLAFGICVLYVLHEPAVRAYFGGTLPRGSMKPPGVGDDAF